MTRTLRKLLTKSANNDNVEKQRQIRHLRTLHISVALVVVNNLFCQLRTRKAKSQTKTNKLPDRRKEHFCSVLNRPDPENEADAETDLDIDICSQRLSIAAMRSGRAGGIDGVTAAMLKSEMKRGPALLTSLFEDTGRL